MYEELVKELRDSAEWADRLALLMGRAEGDVHAPVMRRAADAIEKLQEDNAVLNGTVSNLIRQIAELSKPKWIPVTEQLPSKGANVLVYEFGRVEQAYITTCTADSSPCWVVINGYSYHRISDADCPIKWWMPLPQAPKEE